MTEPVSRPCLQGATAGWRRWLIALAIVLGGAAAAQAQTPSMKRPADGSGPTWSALTPEQRSVLSPLQDDWSSIDAPRKAKWLDLAARYPKMPPGDQQRLQERMTEWARLTPQQRARARLNYQQAKQMPNQERQDQWQEYQALSESERKAWASRAGAAPQSETRAKPPPIPSSKRNIVANPSLSAAPAKPVAPTVIQAAPGATTTLVTRQPAPPAHQQAGMPKIAATPGFVDRKTLLPQRGAQSAGVRTSASAPAGRP